MPLPTLLLEYARRDFHNILIPDLSTRPRPYTVMPDNLKKKNPILPHDIWVTIARYIPRRQLIDMYTVNRSFFDIAMKVRYASVSFDRYDKRLFNYLGDKKDLPIGPFVRRLHIQPWVVKLVEPRCSLTSKFLTFLNQLCDPEYVQRRTEEKVKKRVQKHIRRTSNAVVQFEKVEEYRIDWDEQPDYHAELFSAFLTPTLKMLEKNLVRLSLKVPTEKLCTLASVSLPQLKELELSLCTERFPKKDIDEVFDVFLIFVHNLHLTLESLSIESTNSSAYLDLSRFFKYLGYFSRLRRFALSIPFDGAHLSTPSHLREFLNKHNNTLRHIRLSTSRCSVNMNPSDPNFRGDWIQKCLPSVPFAYLRSLEIALRPLRAPLCSIIKYLRSVSTTIESLVLTDRSLTHEEVQQILGALVQEGGELGLSRLGISVRYMNVELMDMLAQQLPQLRRLELAFTELTYRRGDGIVDVVGRQEEPTSFLAEMGQRQYTNWGLSHIRMPPKCPCLPELENIFFRCIPALRSFETL